MALLPLPTQPSPPSTVRAGDPLEVTTTLWTATLLVQQGWVQDSYLVVWTQSGAKRRVTPLELGWVRPGQVAAVCLVSAIAYGAWSLRQRPNRAALRATLDRAWRSLAPSVGGDRDGALGFGPNDRARRMQDLTRWNDAPARTQDQVVALLTDAADASDAPRPCDS